MKPNQPWYMSPLLRSNVLNRIVDHAYVKTQNLVSVKSTLDYALARLLTKIQNYRRAHPC